MRLRREAMEAKKGNPHKKLLREVKATQDSANRSAREQLKNGKPKPQVKPSGNYKAPSVPKPPKPTPKPPSTGPTAEQMRQATRRAGTQSRRPGRGGLIAPLSIGATIADWMTDNLPRTATPSGRGTGRATDRVKPGPPRKDEPKATPPKSTSPKPQGRNWSNPHGQVSNKPSTGDHKSASKPKPTKPTPTKPTKTKPTKAAPTRKPQSKDMDANYKAWAKANPKLAKKVKKGQSGYKSLNPSTPNRDSVRTKPRTWLTDNYKPNKKKK